VFELSEPSVVSLPVMETVTSAVGAAFRTTVNVEEPPASVVRRFPEPSVVPVWVMVTPLVSSSIFVTLVAARSVPAYPPVFDAVAISEYV